MFNIHAPFHIMRPSTYLFPDDLYDEVQVRIVQGMIHKLFHAFFGFAEHRGAMGNRLLVPVMRCPTT